MARLPDVPGAPMRPVGEVHTLAGLDRLGLLMAPQTDFRTGRYGRCSDSLKGGYRFGRAGRYSPLFSLPGV